MNLNTNFKNNMLHISIRLPHRSKEYQIYIPQSKLTSTYRALAGKKKGEIVWVGQKELRVLDIL